jgi:phosphonopyruvate decarboxylase
MIRPDRLYSFLQQAGISFYTGVPDSLLKDFLKYIEDNAGKENHIITANEGLAVSLAAGYHFSTGKMPLVYLQNSGLGNIINPLTSLADKEMYAVPMLLMIGWRGRPGSKDEPQHIKMGRITTSMLDVLEVPYLIMDENEDSLFEKITIAIGMATKESKPVALLFPENIFEVYKGVSERDKYLLQREEVIDEIVRHLQGDETVVCTTGKIGREFYEQNVAASNKISKYFLSVGAMGHANHIALGINLHTKEKVIMLDGDGALLMQMGSMTSIGHHAKKQFIHIVINNGSHESVGGQPTEGFFANLEGIATACGYNKTICITTKDELSAWLNNELTTEEIQFVEIRTNRNSRTDVGRPDGNPADWKKDFMKALHQKK